MSIHRNERENWLYKYRPHYPRFEQIPHYYGDVVRGLFLASVLIMLGGAPFYADMLKQQLPFLIVGAAVMVILAATTKPRGGKREGAPARGDGVGGGGGC